jgi:hypothetical protein
VKNTPKIRENFRKKAYPPTLLLVQIAPYIANEAAKKILFDLIYDSDRLTGFFILSAEINGLNIRPLKRI